MSMRCRPRARVSRRGGRGPPTYAIVGLGRSGRQCRWAGITGRGLAGVLPAEGRRRILRSRVPGQSRSVSRGGGMDIADVRRVLIVGSGTMGLQIGLQCATHGYDVAMYDLEPAALEAGPGACAPTRRSSSTRVASARPRATRRSAASPDVGPGRRCGRGGHPERVRAGGPRPQGPRPRAVQCRSARPHDLHDEHVEPAARRPSPRRRAGRTASRRCTSTCRSGSRTSST